MRVFDDEQGHRWQAATAFGSYGAARLVFSRMDTDELRTSAMQAETLQAAEQELETCADDVLLEWLHRAEPWR